MPKSRTRLTLSILLIVFLSYLAVRQSFTLALSGDDWLMHYTIWSIFDVRKETSFLNPLVYFGTYSPHYFFLSIISRIWGYEPIYYYVVSFLTRAFVAIIIFFLVKRLTKRFLSAILAGSIFAVSYLGIETTDWVFNYNHYLGIGIVAIFLIRYFKAKEEKKFKDNLLAGSLFALALIVSPPRMHGLFPLIIITELGWIFIEGRKYNYRKLIERIVIILGFYLLIIRGIGTIVSFLRNYSLNLGINIAVGDYGTEMYAQTINQGLNTMKASILRGQTDFIVDPIASLGNYVMPDMLWAKIPFSTSLIAISIIYGVLTYIVLYLAGLKNKFAPFYILNLFIWFMLVYFLRITNLNTFLYPRVAFALVGGFSVIFTFWLFFLLRKTKPLLAHTVLLGFGWMFAFILFPWLLSPASGIMFAWGRYSVQQAAGLSVWISVIFLIIIDALRTKDRYFLLGTVYLVVLLFTLMHLKFTNNYLSHVNSYRSNRLDNKYWNIITSEIPSIDKNRQSIFLLLTDLESAEIAEAIRFGFFGRSIMHYNITNQNYNPFMVVNEYDGIFSAIYDGKFLSKHGRVNPKPIMPDQIYAFYLQNKEMYNVTDQVRRKLKDDLEALKRGNQPPQQITPWF